MSEQETPQRKPYPSDITDEQWDVRRPSLPPAKRGGRPRTVNLREVLNGIFYVDRTGCQWDALPNDLPPKSTVHGYFNQWRKDGTWQALLDALRRMVRVQEGRDPTPSLACIDSQSVKGTEIGGDNGYDGGKKIKGRKRHIVVDSLGLLMAVVVTTAALDDGVAAPLVLAQLRAADYPRLEVILGDSKYRSHKLRRWMQRLQVAYRIQVRQRPEDAVGFVPIKGRWVVERTFAWLGRYRRLSKEYDYYTEVSAAWVKVSAVHMMLKRLEPNRCRHNPTFKYPKKVGKAV